MFPITFFYLQITNSPALSLIATVWYQDFYQVHPVGTFFLLCHLLVFSETPDDFQECRSRQPVTWIKITFPYFGKVQVA